MSEIVGVLDDTLGNMSREIIDETSKRDLVANVAISSLIVPFYYFFERPALSVVTVALVLFLWGYATMGLCVFGWMIEEWLEQRSTDTERD